MIQIIVFTSQPNGLLNSYTNLCKRIKNKIYIPRFYDFKWTGKLKDIQTLRQRLFFLQM